MYLQHAHVKESFITILARKHWRFSMSSHIMSFEILQQLGFIFAFIAAVLLWSQMVFMVYIEVSLCFEPVGRLESFRDWTFKMLWFVEHLKYATSLDNWWKKRRKFTKKMKTYELKQISHANGRSVCVCECNFSLPASGNSWPHKSQRKNFTTI